MLCISCESSNTSLSDGERLDNLSEEIFESIAVGEDGFNIFWFKDVDFKTREQIINLDDWFGFGSVYCVEYGYEFLDEVIQMTVEYIDVPENLEIPENAYSSLMQEFVDMFDEMSIQNNWNLQTFDYRRLGEERVRFIMTGNPNGINAISDCFMFGKDFVLLNIFFKEEELYIASVLETNILLQRVNWNSEVLQWMDNGFKPRNEIFYAFLDSLQKLY